jgi:hypothetical protein
MTAKDFNSRVPAVTRNVGSRIREYSKELLGSKIKIKRLGVICSQRRYHDWYYPVNRLRAL